MTELRSESRFGRALRSQAPITDGDWHRVGLMWDGSNRILYVDDIEVAKDTQVSLPSSAGDLHIGAGSKLAAGSFWSGLTIEQGGESSEHLSREVRDNFPESAPWDPAIPPDTPAVTEGPGTVIGRYKLLEKIGEGGMAVVYMAEQQEPIRRKVALKIIKLGMDTRQVIARFEAERQALALMDHPSIAKVLDAGATETGRPYFVMELVQGGLGHRILR